MFQITFNTFRCLIHRTINISIPFTFLFIIKQCSLILDRSCIIITLYPIITSIEIFSIPCLISHTPNNNRRVINISLNHSLISGKMCFSKLFRMSKTFLSISHTVTLHISLINYIKTIFIAKGKPFRIIRIMTGTNRIDIQLFHNSNIIYHIFL